MNTILFITNIPSPYRVSFFEELGKHCNLTVVFERKASSERDDSWKNGEFKNFDAVFCDGMKIGVDHALSLKPIIIIKKLRPQTIIITNNISLCGVMEVAYCKLKRIPFCIEGDGAFAPDKESIIKRAVKTFLIKGAEIYYSTCKNHDSYYLKYGARKEKIIRYPFSSIKLSDTKTYSTEEKSNYRKELGIKEEKVLVTAGQFIHRKGFDVLVNAMAQIKEEIGVYILGGDELPFKNDDERIHVVGFKLPQERNKYFAVADLFVLPTREDIWGLVVNEAMALGLPTITTDKCNAGLEMILEGKNGYLVRSEDAEGLSEKIRLFFNMAESERDLMRACALETAEKWTIEEMVRVHMENI